MREVAKSAEAVADEPEPIYEEFDPKGNAIEPSPAMMPPSSAVVNYTWKDRRMPQQEKAQRDNPYYNPQPKPNALGHGGYDVPRPTAHI